MNNTVKAFKNEFPQGWFKNGDEFNGDAGTILWTGEGWDIDGLPAFDPDFHYNSFGVHPSLQAFADEQGIYLEAYDGATLMGYKA